MTRASFLVLVCSAAACAMVGGCAAEQAASDQPMPQPAQNAARLAPPPAPSASAASSAAPAVIGQSVQGRPIQLFSFGAGARPVLIMGAIHGNEPTSANITAGLLADLRATPQLAVGVPVVIIPVANPDGLAAGTRTNTNKVDLNRNFPATNWSARAPKRVRNNFGGQTSASEPETLALIQTIERLNPRLIISVHSMDSPCNNYDGPAQAVAEAMSQCNGYPATPTIGYSTPGSMGSWAGIDRQIPMITLELPRKLPADQAWPANRSAILSAIAAVK